MMAGKQQLSYCAGAVVDLKSQQHESQIEGDTALFYHHREQSDDAFGWLSAGFGWDKSRDCPC